MALISSVNANVRRLENLAHYSEAANGSLYKAGTRLDALRRDHKGSVSADLPDAMVAASLINRAQRILDEGNQFYTGLPAASEAVQLFQKGSAELAKAVKVAGQGRFNPGRLSDMLPNYELQEARLAALRDVDGVTEGVATLLADESSVGSVPASIRNARIDKAANALDSTSAAMKEAKGVLEVASSLASKHFDRLSAANPKARDFVVERHLLDSWGIRPLASDGARMVGAAAENPAVPFGSDVISGMDRVMDALDPITQGPTDPIEERTISLGRTRHAVADAAHQAALLQHESKREADAVRLVKVYGQR